MALAEIGQRMVVLTRKNKEEYQHYYCLWTGVEAAHTLKYHDEERFGCGQLCHPRRAAGTYMYRYVDNTMVSTQQYIG